MATEATESESRTPFFSFTTFGQLLLNAGSLSAAELQQQLEKPENRERLAKPFAQLFPCKEADVGAAWNHSVTAFRSVDLALSKELLEMMRSLAESCNISISRVYEYLDFILRSNPQLVKVFQRAELIAATYASVEEQIVDFWHRERTAYLRALYVLAAHRALELGEEQSAVLGRTLEQLLAKEAFLDKLVEDYVTVGRSESPYLQRNPNLHAIAKLKEELLLLKTLFSLVACARQPREFDALLSRLAPLFLRQRFAGSLPALLSAGALAYSDISDFVGGLADQVNVLQVLLLLAVPLGRPTDAALTALARHVGEYARAEPEDAPLSEKVAFFAVLLSLVVRTLARSEQTEQEAIAALEAAVASEGGEGFAESFHAFIALLAKAELGAEPGIAPTLKRLLECLAQLDQKDSALLSTALGDEGGKQILLYKLLKTVLGMPALLIEYWRGEFRSNAGIDIVVQKNLDSFPFNTVIFAKTAALLVGGAKAPFAEETCALLRQLERVTLELNRKPRLAPSGDERDAFAEVLAAPIETAEGLEIPSGTPASLCGNNIYTFQHSCNFFEFMLRELGGWLAFLRANPRATLQPPAVACLKLLTRLVEAAPNYASRLTRHCLGLDEGDDSRPPALLVILLLEYLAALRAANENPKLGLRVLVALKALLISENANFARWALAAQPTLGDPRASALSFLEHFQRAEEEVDTYRLYERQHIEGATLAVELAALLCADSDFVAVQLRPAVARAADEDQKRERVAQLINRTAADGAFFERGTDLDNEIVELFRNSEPLPGALEDFFEHSFVPLCRRALRDDIDVQYENVGFKYRLYAQCFQFLRVLVERLGRATPRFALALPGLGARVSELVARAPLFELLLDAFEPRLNAELLERRDAPPNSRAPPLENKHFVEHVVQRKNRTAERAISAFLASACELLDATLSAATRQLQSGEESFELPRRALHLFCERETFQQYLFTNFNGSYRVNIVLALAAVLDVREQLPPATTFDGFENVCCEAAEELFAGDETAVDAFLSNVDALWLNGRVLKAPTQLQSSQTLSESVFRALAALARFWRVQQRARRPALEDFFGNSFNDLPDGARLFSIFVYKVLTALFRPSPPLLAFLLECTRSQRRFLDELSRREIEKGQPSLLTALETAFARPLEPALAHALLRFCLAALAQSRPRRALHERLAQLFLDRLLAELFRAVEQKDDFVRRLVAFSFAATCEGRESGSLLVELPPADHSAALNALRAWQLVAEERQFDRLLEALCKLVLGALLGRAKSRAADFFSPAPPALARGLAQLLPRLGDLAFGPTLIALRKLHFSLVSDYIPCLFAELAATLGHEREASDPAFALREATAPTKTVYDAEELFVALRVVGVGEQYAFAAAHYAAHANLTNTLLRSKVRVFEPLTRLQSVLLSLGLPGAYCGARLLATPTAAHLGRYALCLSRSLAESSASLSDQLLSFLPTRLEPFGDLSALRPDLCLRPRERQLLLPFARDGGLGLNALNLLQPSQPRLSEESAQNAISAISSQCAAAAEQLEVLCVQFGIGEDFADNVDGESYVLLEMLCRQLIPWLRSFVHFQSQVGVLLRQSPRPPHSLPTILNRLLRLLPFVEEQRATFKRNVAVVVRALLYLLLALRDGDALPSLAALADALIAFLDGGYRPALELLVALDLLAQLQPATLGSAHLAALCRALGDEETPLDAFAAIAALLTRLVEGGQHEQALLAAGITRRALAANCLERSAAFAGCQLYAHRRSEPSHAAFCQLLRLAIAIFFHFKSSAALLQFGLAFLARFQPRFEALLGLNATQPNEATEIAAQFRSLNFIREAALALTLIFLIARDAEFWKLRNPTQFHRFLALLSQRTIRLFAAEQPTTTSAAFFRAPPVTALAERAPPLSLYEEALQSVSLSEQTAPRLSETRSVARSAASAESRAAVSTPAAQNLFAYQLEVSALELLFALGQSLAGMLATADIPALIADPTQPLFDETLFRRLPPALVDHQLHLLHAYQKLQLYPDAFKEGQLRSHLLDRSFEAFLLSAGNAHLCSEFSLKELLHLTRKTFECFFFLQALLFQLFDGCEVRNQHTLVEELKRQRDRSKSLLADFEKAIANRENFTQLMKDSVARTHSPHHSIGRSVSKQGRHAGQLVLRNEEADSRFVNTRSLDAHSRFLDFIRRYYDLH